MKIGIFLHGNSFLYEEAKFVGFYFTLLCPSLMLESFRKVLRSRRQESNGFQLQDISTAQKAGGPTELNTRKIIKRFFAQPLGEASYYLFNNPGRRGTPDSLPAGWQVVRITPSGLNGSSLRCVKEKYDFCCWFSEKTPKISKDFLPVL